jgi:hypothetical protein
MERPEGADCLDLRGTIAKDSCAGVYKSEQSRHVVPDSTALEKLIFRDEFQPAASVMTLQKRLSGTELHQEAYARAWNC